MIAGVSPHDAMIQGKDVVWRLHPQTGHDMIVGLLLVSCQLLTAISQRVHTHVFVKAQFIRAVLASLSHTLCKPRK